MNAYSDELRLALIALLNVGVFATAYRFARRRGGDGALQTACDAFSPYFLVQYAAVGLPGMCGVLSWWTMAAVALAAMVLLEWGARGGSDSRRGAAALSPDFKGQPATAGRSSRKERNPEPQKAPWSRATGDAPAESHSLSYWAQDTHMHRYFTPDRLALLGCAIFAAAFLGGYAWIQRFTPPIATDSLVYHLPTAVQWIQTGKLGIYPTWYWNPAASYSPGTGSMFMAWWMTPAGNEVFVRFVQLPPLMFIFFLVARMARLMGSGRAAAGLIGVAATLSRPLISEAIIQKDDLYVTAFIAAAVLALGQEMLRGPLAGNGSEAQNLERSGASNFAGSAPSLRKKQWHGLPARVLLSGSTGRMPAAAWNIGPWRVGVALGFVLASKYTALLACPVFLFLIDAPFRARWKPRHFLIAIGVVLAMALPWYLRNILLTHNPLYPVNIRFAGLRLPGLFGVERDQQLHTMPGVWHMLTETYHSLPLALVAALAVLWIWAAIAGGKRLLRDPLPRACVIGSAITLALFLATSPHHEVRYVFPLMVLWFAAAGLALSSWPFAIRDDFYTRGTGGPPVFFSGTHRRAAHATSVLKPHLRAHHPTQADANSVESGMSDRADSARTAAGGADPTDSPEPDHAGTSPTVFQRRAIFAALAMAVISTVTSFSTAYFVDVMEISGIALLIALAGVGIVYANTRHLHLQRRHWGMLGSAGLLATAMLAYVRWHVYVEECRAYRPAIWAQTYPAPARAWAWVDENVPGDACVAYANTYFVYPYYGFDLSRRVGYAPVRRGLHAFAKFPPMGDRVPGDLIVKRMTEVMDQDADRETWLGNLRAMQAGYLVVMKHDPDLDPDPPELQFARSDRAHFAAVYEDETAVIFRIAK